MEASYRLHPLHDRLTLMSRHRASIFALVITLLGGLGSFVLDGGQQTTGVSHEKAASLPADHPLRSLRTSYRLLRGPEEKAPSFIKSKVQANINTHVAVNKLSSHHIPTPLGAVWVVVTEAAEESVTCLVAESSGSSSCASTRIAAQAGLALGASPSGQVQKALLIGLAPDWVRSVQVKVVGQESQMLPVRHNVFSARAQAPILLRGIA
jgi:hypothetical protein